MAEDFISGMLAGQQFKLNEFMIQEAPLKLEQEKMALTLQKADVDKRQKMADLLASKPPKEDQNPLINAQNALMAMGSAAVKSGLIEEAQKNYQTSAVIGAQMEDAAYKQYQEAAGRAKFSESILANVTDAASWKKANDTITLMTGKPSAMADRPYSPELVHALKEAGIKHLDDATEAYRKAQTRKDEVETSLAPLKAEALLAEKRAAEIRAANAKKAGSDGLLAKPRTVRAAQNYIIQQSNDMMSSADANVIAEKIGPDVEDRMQKKQQTLSEAIHDAYAHYDKTGGTAGIPTAKVRPGTSWKMPAPPPKDLKDLKDKTIYQTASGPMWYSAKAGKLFPRNTGPEGKDIVDDEDEESDD